MPAWRAAPLHHGGSGGTRRTARIQRARKWAAPSPPLFTTAAAEAWRVAPLLSSPPWRRRRVEGRANLESARAGGTPLLPSSPRRRQRRGGPRLSILLHHGCGSTWSRASERCPPLLPSSPRQRRRRGGPRLSSPFHLGGGGAWRAMQIQAFLGRIQWRPPDPGGGGVQPAMSTLVAADPRR